MRPTRALWSQAGLCWSQAGQVGPQDANPQPALSHRTRRRGTTLVRIWPEGKQYSFCLTEDEGGAVLPLDDDPVRPSRPVCASMGTLRGLFERGEVYCDELGSNLGYSHSQGEERTCASTRRRWVQSERDFVALLPFARGVASATIQSKPSIQGASPCFRWDTGSESLLCSERS